MLREIIISSLCFVAAIEAQGEVSKKAPEAKTWANSLDRGKISSLVAPSNILIIQSFSKDTSKNIDIKPLEFNSALCEQVSYIACTSSSDFAYSMKINKIPSSFSEDDLMRSVSSSGLIFGDGAQILFKFLGEAERISIPGAEKLSKNMDARKLFDRLLVALGYDGVVLDVNGDFLLVGTFDARLRKKDLQGLLIKDSKGKILIKSDSAKEGAALLTLVGQYGGYAVFQSVIGVESSSQMIGQKVIIEGR